MPSTGLPKLLGFAFVAIASLLVDITAAAAADPFTETYLSTYRPSGGGGLAGEPPRLA
jgi:hypothetical protein